MFGSGSFGHESNDARLWIGQRAVEGCGPMSLYGIEVSGFEWHDGLLVVEQKGVWHVHWLNRVGWVNLRICHGEEVTRNLINSHGWHRSTRNRTYSIVCQWAFLCANHLIIGVSWILRKGRLLVIFLISFANWLKHSAWILEAEEVLTILQVLIDVIVLYWHYCLQFLYYLKVYCL